MFHNDVLRRLRYALAINDTAAIGIFKLVDYDIEIGYLHSIMKKEDEEGYLPCRDKLIALFLDGLIIKNRGKQEGSAPTMLAAGERLSNNEVLRKIRIAMRFKDEDMIDVLKLADFRISKGELSAFFRKPDHRNYKPAGDQVVRNFLQGMVKKYRPDSTRQTSTRAKDKLGRAGVSTKTANNKKPSKGKSPYTNKNKTGSQNKGHSTNDTHNRSTPTKSVWGKIEKPTR